MAAAPAQAPALTNEQSPLKLFIERNPMKLPKRHLLLSALSLALASLMPLTAQAQAQNLKWNMPTPYADGSFHTKNTRLFADEIRQASGGRIDITVNANGALFKMPEIKRAVQTGQVPIAETNLPAYGNEFAFLTSTAFCFWTVATTRPSACGKFPSRIWTSA
jgi:TRAP-type C4-dicarboxylate transport system substrate-binding protein